MAPLQFSKMEINAMLTGLTEKWDKEVAEQVIEVYNDKLKPRRNVAESIYRKENEYKENITGHTKEAGNISHEFKTQEEDAGLIIKTQAKELIERVGQFKLWKREYSKYSRYAFIEFKYFQTIDISNDYLPFPVYSIKYRKQDKKIVHFVKLEFERIGKQISAISAIVGCPELFRRFIKSIAKGKSSGVEQVSIKTNILFTNFTEDEIKKETDFPEKNLIFIVIVALCIMQFLFMFSFWMFGFDNGEHRVVVVPISVLTAGIAAYLILKIDYNRMDFFRK